MSSNSLRLKIAYFSPLPPARSGIADYSAELLPHLAQYADLTLFVEEAAGVDTLALPIQPITDYPAMRHQFDVALYQIGNSDHHAAIYAMALRYPGIIVLHDYFLHHFIAYRTLQQGDKAGYGRELAYALGVDGVALAEAIRRGWATPPVDSVPLSDRIVDVSLGTLVHSQFVADQLQANGAAPVRLVDALVTPFAGQSRRAETGFPADAILFGSYGQITPGKQMAVLLEAFAALAESDPRLRLLLVGEPRDVDVDGLLAQFGVADRVFQTGFVPDLATFVDWIHTAEVVVNLRHPTMGETSATALRAMAAGKPVIVTDQGWYAELAESAVVKIPPDDATALQAAMANLANDAALRETMGAAARAITAAHNAPAHVARAYIAAIDAMLQGVWR